MKKVFMGTPKDIARQVKEYLEQVGLSESENDEAFQQILIELLD